jgi:hypothetical protein
LSLPLPTLELPPTQFLYHVSRTAYAGSALYFGCHANRYDDPHGRFGVLYVAFDLATALMESMFHAHQWSDSRRVIDAATVSERLVREIAAIERLHVVDLSAPGAMAGHFGLNLHQLTSRDYAHTQQIAQLSHAQPDVDGILYPSRNNYPGMCLALFDRCKDKIGLLDDVPLERHRRWSAFVDDYAIQVHAL